MKTTVKNSACGAALQNSETFGATRITLRPIIGEISAHSAREWGPTKTHTPSCGHHTSQT